jgi:hypothetical protein
MVINDMLTAIGQIQHDSRELAGQIRETVRHQLRRTDGKPALNDGPVTVELTRTQWQYLVEEVQRRTSDEAPGDATPGALQRQALETIASSLYGEALDETPVSTGRTATGLDWTITVTGRRDTPYACLTVSRDGQGGTAGIGVDEQRPKSVMSVLTSSYTDMPTLVMAVVDEAIDRFVVTTRDGVELDVPLSAPHPVLHKRFGTTELPEDADIGSMHAETGGFIVERQPHYGSRPRPNRR